MYSQKEITKVLKNPMTKQLVEWVDSTKKTTRILMSPQFFHHSHTNKDREVICFLLKNFYNCKIERIGSQSVKIEF